MKPKYKVWSLLTVRQIRDWNGAWSRKTGFPVRFERYHSIWNDLKLAWLVFTRKADAIIWEDNIKHQDDTDKNIQK